MPARSRKNDWAKKRDVAIEAISTLLDTCRDYNVDLIGCDMNQGVALRKTHTTSPLLEAMTSFCQKHGIGVENADFRELLAQAPGDCCGFIIMPSSSMFTDFIVVKHGWAPFLSTDIGLRRTDADAHYPCHMFLRSTHHARTYKRSDEAWAKVAARKAEKRAELRAKKKARLTHEE